MKILGIETSCDDTAAAVIKVEGGFRKPSLPAGRQVFSVLSNVSYSQVAIHKKFGGIVPNLASRAHLQKIAPTVKAALSISKTNRDKIDLIAVTRGPGLMPSLLVGVNFARALAYKWQKPIIGVNHIEGHIYSNWLLDEHRLSSLAFLARPGEARSGIRPRSVAKGDLHARFGLITRSERTGDVLLPMRKEIFPALVLVVSGGHTELVLMKDYGRYKIIGETLDDAAGECFDKTARILGLGFPGGPAIAVKAAKILNPKSEIRNKFQIPNSRFQVQLPRPMINSRDYNFSFSGLKTAVLYLYNDLIKKYPSKEIVPALANEIQQAIIDVLVAKTLKAVKKFRPETVMIAGGVAANKRLREEMALKIAPYGIAFSAPDLIYTTDNAAMIATAGYFNYLKKKPGSDSWKKIIADANLKLL